MKIKNKHNDPSPFPLRGCVVIGETVKNVMPNLFRHLIKSRSYETLKQPMKQVQGMVQGDKIGITTQPLRGEGGMRGKKILITRALEQSREFTSRLKKLGAEVISFPTIEIVPPVSWKKLDQALDRIHSYDWIIFTSANGVVFFLQRMKATRKNRRSLSCSKMCAIGPATAQQLRKRGIKVDYIPKEFIAESILRGFKKLSIKGKRILLARAKKARDVLPKGLKNMGARVDVVEAYRTVKPKGGTLRLKRFLTKKEIDVLTFTSSSTVTHFVDLLKKEDLKTILKGIAIACIGPVTARTVREAGLKVHIQPEEYTIPALTQAIAEYFTKKTNDQYPKE